MAIFEAVQSMDYLERPILTAREIESHNKEHKTKND
jgi:hypothetical protein